MKTKKWHKGMRVVSDLSRLVVGAEIYAVDFGEFAKVIARTADGFILAAPRRARGDRRLPARFRRYGLRGRPGCLPRLRLRPRRRRDGRLLPRGGIRLLEGTRIERLKSKTGRQRCRASEPTPFQR